MESGDGCEGQQNQKSLRSTVLANNGTKAQANNGTKGKWSLEMDAKVNKTKKV